MVERSHLQRRSSEFVDSSRNSLQRPSMFEVEETEVPAVQTQADSISPESEDTGERFRYYTPPRFTIFPKEPPSYPLPAPNWVQPKLTMGAVDDPYEQEADRVAEQVVNQIAAPGTGNETPAPVQRQEMTEESGELQRQPESSFLQRLATGEEYRNYTPPQFTIWPTDQPRQHPAYGSIQRQELAEEDEELQRQPENSTVQRKAVNDRYGSYTPPRFTIWPTDQPWKHPAYAGTVQAKLTMQAKLTIGAVDDPYEQEADRVADQVVNQIQSPATTQATQGQGIQRQEELEEELQTKPEITTLQRQEERDATEETAPDLESAINSARGSGQPLEEGLQRSMGQAMGADFSGVRIHTDAQSDQLNQSIQAKAFTTGQDVFFRQGEYQPEHQSGQKLIAHELTHVVQQTASLHRKENSQPQPDSAKAGEASALIVEDSITDLSQGQMTKSEFLNRLYQALYAVGTEAFQGTNLTVEGCPYIVYWFDRYRGEESTHIEQALRKYASAPPTIASTEALIQLICERAQRGFKAQVKTGEITELPEDVPQALGENVVPEPDMIVQREIVGIQRKAEEPINQKPTEPWITSDVKTPIIQRGCTKGPKELPGQIDIFDALRQGANTTNAMDESRKVLTSQELEKGGYALLPMLEEYVEKDKKQKVQQFDQEQRNECVYQLNQEGRLVHAVSEKPLTTEREIDLEQAVRIFMQANIEPNWELPQEQLFQQAKEIGGSFIFVMNEAGEIFAAEEEIGVLHHSSFLSGGAVAAAGHIRVKNGVIERVSNISGHYKPSPAYLWQALMHMQKQGVNLQNVQVEVRDVKPFSNAAEFLQAFNPAQDPQYFDNKYAVEQLNQLERY